MDLEHSFIIPVPPEQAWQALLDVEQVAPCMPGATVDAFDGEVISGKIKVKVGPVQMTYAGTARFTEKDEATKTVVLEASGKETRGSGTASATVRSSLQDEGGQTRVLVRTSMTITGRPAQFGRGVIAEVGGRVIGKFATNLAAQLSGEGTPAATAASTPAASTPEVQYPGSQCPGGGDPGHEHPGRGGRDRGQRRGRGRRGSGAAADRGAGPAGPLLQQPAARGRAHGREPRRPDGEGTARHRRSRAPVDQGDQGQARRPRAGPHHARRDHGRGLGHRCRGRFRRPGNQHHERGATTSTAAAASTGASTATGITGPRPAAATPGTGGWDADAPSTDRAAANGLLPPRGARPQDEEALDLLSVAGLPLLKRLAPLVGFLLIAGVLVRIVRRRRRASRA